MTASSAAKFCGSVDSSIGTDIPLRVAVEAIPLVKANAQFKEIDTMELIRLAKERCKNRLVITNRLMAIAVLIAVRQHKTI